MKSERKAPRHMPVQRHTDIKKETRKTGVSHVDAIHQDYNEYLEECEARGVAPVLYHEMNEWYARLYEWSN